MQEVATNDRPEESAPQRTTQGAVRRFMTGCKHWFFGRPKIVSGRELTNSVLGILERAEQEVVLATAYLHPWPELELTVREALGRRLRVHCVVRNPDGTRSEREKLSRGIEAMRQLGVRVHLVDRLHAKVYLSEKEAIVCSLNLVGASQSSVEFGVHFRDPEYAGKCREELARYCPELDKGALARYIQRFRSSRARPSRPQRSEVLQGADETVEAIPPAKKRRAFCIGCGRDRSFNRGFWFCRRCYDQFLDSGKDVAVFATRHCYECGCPNMSTPQQPFCDRCSRRRA